MAENIPFPPPVDIPNTPDAKLAFQRAIEINKGKIKLNAGTREESILDAKEYRKTVLLTKDGKKGQTNLVDYLKEDGQVQSMLKELVRQGLFKEADLEAIGINHKIYLSGEKANLSLYRLSHQQKADALNFILEKFTDGSLTKAQRKLYFKRVFNEVILGGTHHIDNEGNPLVIFSPLDVQTSLIVGANEENAEALLQEGYRPSDRWDSRDKSRRQVAAQVTRSIRPKYTRDLEGKMNIGKKRLKESVEDDLRVGQAMYNALTPPDYLLEVGRLQMQMDKTSDPTQKENLRKQIVDKRREIYASLLSSFQARIGGKYLDEINEQTAQMRVLHTAEEITTTTEKYRDTSIFDANRSSLTRISSEVLGINENKIKKVVETLDWSNNKIQRLKDQLRKPGFSENYLNDLVYQKLFEEFYGSVKPSEGKKQLSADDKTLLQSIFKERVITEITLRDRFSEVEDPSQITISTMQDWGIKGLDLLFRRTLPSYRVNEPYDDYVQRLRDRLRDLSEGPPPTTPEPTPAPPRPPTPPGPTPPPRPPGPPTPTPGPGPTATAEATLPNELVDLELQLAALGFTPQKIKDELTITERIAHQGLPTETKIPIYKINNLTFALNEEKKKALENLRQGLHDKGILLQIGNLTLDIPKDNAASDIDLGNYLFDSLKITGDPNKKIELNNVRSQKIDVGKNLSAKVDQNNIVGPNVRMDQLRLADGSTFSLDEKSIPEFFHTDTEIVVENKANFQILGAGSVPLEAGKYKIKKEADGSFGLEKIEAAVTLPTVTTPESPAIKKIKEEIFEKAGKRSKEEMVKLIDEVAQIHYAMLLEGNGKLPTTIQEAEKLGLKEILCDGAITYLPKGNGELVVVGDIHGDFATVRGIINQKGFIENMEAGDKSMMLVFEGDYLDRGKKDVEVMEALLELKRKYPKNVVLMKADHEVLTGVSSHDYPDRAKTHYKDEAVFKGLCDNFLSKLPRLVVCGNGVVMAHGGPTYHELNLQELARVPRDDRFVQVFDNVITWGDPVTDSLFDRWVNGDRDIFTKIDTYISEAEKNTDNTINWDGQKWHLNNLKIIKDRLTLAKKNGFWFNPDRVGEGTVQAAAFGNIAIYSEKGLQTFLDRIGGKVMMRGHQVSSEVEGGKPNPFSKNILWTIHSTGKGSPDSDYAYRETSPSFAVFDRNLTISEIDPAKNIVAVNISAKPPPVTPPQPQPRPPTTPPPPSAPPTPPPVTPSTPAPTTVAPSIVTLPSLSPTLQELSVGPEDQELTAIVGKGMVQSQLVAGHHGVVQDIVSVNGKAVAVADGVTGAGPNSRIAAQIASEEAAIFLNTQLTSILTPEEIASEVEKFVDTKIQPRALAEAKGGTTTLIAGVIKGKKLILIRAGDSEAYIFRKDKIIELDPAVEASSESQVSRDTQGGYGGAPNQLGGRFKGSKITIHDVEAGDRILFTSDGLNRSVLLTEKFITGKPGDWSMQNTLARVGTTTERIMNTSATPAEAEEKLIQSAVKGGLLDDVSAGVIFVEKNPNYKAKPSASPTPPQPPPPPQPSPPSTIAPSIVTPSSTAAPIPPTSAPYVPPQPPTFPTGYNPTPRTTAISTKATVAPPTFSPAYQPRPRTTTPTEAAAVVTPPTPLQPPSFPPNYQPRPRTTISSTEEKRSTRLQQLLDTMAKKVQPEELGNDLKNINDRIKREADAAFTVGSTSELSENDAFDLRQYLYLQELNLAIKNEDALNKKLLETVSGLKIKVDPNKYKQTLLVLDRTRSVDSMESLFYLLTEDLHPKQEKQIRLFLRKDLHPNVLKNKGVDIALANAVIRYGTASQKKIIIEQLKEYFGVPGETKPAVEPTVVPAATLQPPAEKKSVAEILEQLRVQTRETGEKVKPPESKLTESELPPFLEDRRRSEPKAAVISPTPTAQPKPTPPPTPEPPAPVATPEPPAVVEETAAKIPFDKRKAEATEKFAQLKRRVDSGESISRRDYENQTFDLSAMRDDQNHLWEINPHTGKWMVYDEVTQHWLSETDWQVRLEERQREPVVAAESRAEMVREAERIAKHIRETGAGYLGGYIPDDWIRQQDIHTSGANESQAFAFGQDFPNAQTVTNHLRTFANRTPYGAITNEVLSGDTGLLILPYQPPYYMTYDTKEGGFFNKKIISHKIPSYNIRELHQARGRDEVITGSEKITNEQVPIIGDKIIPADNLVFVFTIPINRRSHERRDDDVEMVFTVDAQTAQTIKTEALKNPHFMFQLFHSLYPDLKLYSDDAKLSTYDRRRYAVVYPTKELLTIDATGTEAVEQRTAIPQPLPDFLSKEATEIKDNDAQLNLNAIKAASSLLRTPPERIAPLEIELDAYYFNDPRFVTDNPLYSVSQTRLRGILQEVTSSWDKLKDVSAETVNKEIEAGNNHYRTTLEVLKAGHVDELGIDPLLLTGKLVGVLQEGKKYSPGEILAYVIAIAAVEKNG